MRLGEQIDLGYCTNIHRGETWEETFKGLSEYVNEVRRRVCPDAPYGIGLRLSDQAARTLDEDPEAFASFKAWLRETNSYVFTINGFPFGTFHGSRVKDQVYAPDWATPERLEYTERLFRIGAEMSPEHSSFSVSTLPGSFKGFFEGLSGADIAGKEEAIFDNFIQIGESIESLRKCFPERDFHLGVEPEPLGWFENTPETVAFFDRLIERCTPDQAAAVRQNIGVNYDTCHLALEYEDAAHNFALYREKGIRISKIHLSSALTLKPTDENLQKVKEFQDEVYLHQVMVGAGGALQRSFKDLPPALEWGESAEPEERGEEWRVHFHVPLHAEFTSGLGDTRFHLEAVLEELAKSPDLCQHFEMETYTWEVMPAELHERDVVDQLEAEYAWTLDAFDRVGITRAV